MTVPYVPHTPLQSSLRALYRSIAQVSRLVPTFLSSGSMSAAWEPVSDILDIFLETPGQFACRLDVGFLRPGKDAPSPMVAGRAPDRVGLLFFDPVTNPNTGALLVKAGDRLTMVSGPVTGTWELRQVPEVAQDFTGAHHIEAQVTEVSQALEPGSLTPFPGTVT